MSNFLFCPSFCLRQEAFGDQRYGHGRHSEDGVEAEGAKIVLDEFVREDGEEGGEVSHAHGQAGNYSTDLRHDENKNDVRYLSELIRYY